jgi:hypothetical protein
MQHVLLFVQAIIRAPVDPEMTKQGIAGKRKHIAVTIPQKLEIITRLEGGRN